MITPTDASCEKKNSNVAKYNKAVKTRCGQNPSTAGHCNSKINDGRRWIDYCNSGNNEDYTWCGTNDEPQCKSLLPDYQQTTNVYVTNKYEDSEHNPVDDSRSNWNKNPGQVYASWHAVQGSGGTDKRESTIQT